jgi:hypothetical protein
LNHRTEKSNLRVEKLNLRVEKSNLRVEKLNLRVEKSNHRTEKSNHRVEKLNHGNDKFSHGAKKSNHRVKKLNHGVKKCVHGRENLPKTPTARRDFGKNRDKLCNSPRRTSCSGLEMRPHEAFVELLIIKLHRIAELPKIRSPANFYASVLNIE